MAAAKRILVGKIAAAHGVKGLVKIQFYGGDESCLENCGSLFTSETGDECVTLRLKHRAGTALVAEMGGIADRNEAEKKRGTELWVERDKLPAPAAGEYYHADLIGLSVVDETGAALGTVTAIDNFGAGDLLEIKPETGESFYLPLAGDFVLDVDIQNSRIIVRRPDAL